MFRRLGRTQLSYLLVGVLLVLMTPFLFGFNTAKRIVIKYDGKTKEISSSSIVPKLILLSAGITLNAGDGWRFEEGHSLLKDGCILEVVRGVDFKVSYNGQSKALKSSKATVGEALTDVGINFRGKKLYPEAHVKLQPGMQIFILNKGEHFHFKEINGATPIQYIEDKNLAAGTEKVEKHGRPDQYKVISKTSVNAQGEHVNIELGKVLIEAGEPKLIRKGTALSVKTPKGYKRYSKKLTCEATAYTHTGNPTATGIMPYVGVIAVDPRYIPLGTKVYIPGYGLATAADTGGAIIHHRIDLFLNSEYECIQWGRRNVAVYILEE